MAAVTIVGASATEEFVRVRGPLPEDVVELQTPLTTARGQYCLTDRAIMSLCQPFGREPTKSDRLFLSRPKSIILFSSLV